MVTAVAGRHVVGKGSSEQPFCLQGITWRPVARHRTEPPSRLSARV